MFKKKIDEKMLSISIYQRILKKKKIYKDSERFTQKSTTVFNIGPVRIFLASKSAY